MMRATCMLAGIAITVTAAAAAPPAFHETVASDEPVLWYQFNEPAGTEAAVNHGSLGSGFDGMFHNDVTLETPTIGGDTGVTFYAPDQQYVESGAVAPDGFLGNPSFTAETVVYIPSDGRGCPIWAPFLHWGAPETGRSVFFGLSRCTRNRAFAGFYNGGLLMDSVFRFDGWNHIVWVRDSNGGEAESWEGTTLYVNSRPVPLVEDEHLPGAPDIDVSATTFRVQKATDAERFFTGRMDEVMLYDRMLTPEEVVEHYEALRVCRPDLDNNGAIDFNDLLTLLATWGPCEIEGHCPEDLDRSGDVDFNDLLAVLAAWGPCE